MHLRPAAPPEAETLGVTEGQSLYTVSVSPLPVFLPPVYSPVYQIPHSTSIHPSAHRNKKKVRVPLSFHSCPLNLKCYFHSQRCDATRPICQRCTVARYQDECMYDAFPPDPSTELSQPQVRRFLARRTLLLGDTLEPRPAVPGSKQSPPHPGLQSSNTLPILPQSGYPTNEVQNVSPVPPSQDVQSTTSTSFTHVQPLQKRPDYFQPCIIHSHRRSHQTHCDQERPPGSSSSEDEVTAERSVVVRTATLVPSSPLLKSTVTDSPASDPVHHSYPQNEYLIQADPTSPYYTFQDTRLILNPIIRVYMANSTNPKMFSLQNISPDTMTLLLSVFISARKPVQEVIDSGNPF